MAKLSEKYGDVFTVWFFNKPTVILSSFEAVKQAYIDRQHDFASRPDTLVGKCRRLLCASLRIHDVMDTLL